MLALTENMEKFIIMIVINTINSFGRARQYEWQIRNFCRVMEITRSTWL